MRSSTVLSLWLCNDQGLLMLLANTYLVNLAKIHTGYTYKKTASYFMTDKD